MGTVAVVDHTLDGVRFGQKLVSLDGAQTVDDHLHHPQVAAHLKTLELCVAQIVDFGANSVIERLDELAEMNAVFEFDEPLDNIIFKLGNKIPVYSSGAV